MVVTEMVARIGDQSKQLWSFAVAIASQRVVNGLLVASTVLCEKRLQEKTGTMWFSKLPSTYYLQPMDLMPT